METTAAAREVQARLFALQDLEYKAFQSKLLPTLPAERIIGVRTPALRKLAGELKGTELARAFLRSLPHMYYEENNLHGCLIGQIRDYGACIEALQTFLPYVDNWASCDLLSPPVLKKNREALLEEIRRWLAEDHVYTKRFAIGRLMALYLDEAFQPEYLELVAGLRSDEYYVNMMIAWYFATALAKQYAAALPYMQAGRLALWTHNKAIQKALESDRVLPAHKAQLRTLKRKAEPRKKA